MTAENSISAADDTASETSAAAGSHVLHASSSEGIMRSASSSAAQEGALPPPFHAGSTGALSQDHRELKFAAEAMHHDPKVGTANLIMLRTALAQAVAAAAEPLVALAAE